MTVKLLESEDQLPRALLVTGVVIRTLTPVAYGAFSDVFQGDLGNQVVAIKFLRIHRDVFESTKVPDCRPLTQRPDSYDDAQKSLWREAIVWRQLNHSNVLPFYGLTDFDGRVGMISPWMERGNIMQYLASAAPGREGRLRLVRNSKPLRYDAENVQVASRKCRRPCSSSSSRYRTR